MVHIIALGRQTFISLMSYVILVRNLRKCGQQWKGGSTLLVLKPASMSLSLFWLATRSIGVFVVAIHTYGNNFLQFERGSFTK